jgi:protein SCO1/2
MRCVLLLMLALPCSALAQSYGKAPAEPAREPHLPDVPIEQRLGEKVPTDLVFRDEHDNPVTLAQCINGKPTILVLAYYRCPMLCNQVLNGVVECVKDRRIPWDLGNQFNIVTVSFDPKDRIEQAWKKKQSYLQEYNRPGAENGWHFLTGEKAAVGALCQAAGFHYDYDKKKDVFNHASGIMILTPDGELSKYFYGIVYDPELVRDALADASRGQIGKPQPKENMLTMLCFDYNPSSGRYTLSVMKGLRALAVFTVLGIGTWLFLVYRKQRRQPTAGPASVPVGSAPSSNGRAESEPKA